MYQNQRPRTSTTKYVTSYPNKAHRRSAWGKSQIATEPVWLRICVGGKRGIPTNQRTGKKTTLLTHVRWHRSNLRMVGSNPWAAQGDHDALFWLWWSSLEALKMSTPKLLSTQTPQWGEQEQMVQKKETAQKKRGGGDQNVRSQKIWCFLLLCKNRKRWRDRARKLENLSWPNPHSHKYRKTHFP